MNLLIDIVNPAIERGRPPRPITMRDIIRVPVKRSGVWNLGDMLSQKSVGNLFTAYNRAEAAVWVQKHTAPAKQKAHRA